jgi:hypothetical protein
MIHHGIDIGLDRVADFCRRNQIRKLALFGSILRDDFTPESDIDVLVEFKPEARVGFFKLYDIEQELAQILAGRTVEINTFKSLSPYFRGEVLAEAEVLYVEG